MSLWDRLDIYTQREIFALSSRMDKRYCYKCNTYVGNGECYCTEYAMVSGKFYCKKCFRDTSMPLGEFICVTQRGGRIAYYNNEWIVISDDMHEFSEEEKDAQHHYGDVILRYMVRCGESILLTLLSKYVSNQSRNCYVCNGVKRISYDFHVPKGNGHLGRICYECMSRAILRYGTVSRVVDDILYEIYRLNLYIAYQRQMMDRECNANVPDVDHIREAGVTIQSYEKDISNKYQSIFRLLGLPKRT